MTRMGRNQHDHLLGMIERMQRDGTPEDAIHEAVRRAATRTYPTMTRLQRGKVTRR